MSVVKGKYLGCEVCAFSGDWLVVQSDRNEFIVFNCMDKGVMERFDDGMLPLNKIGHGQYIVEYFPTFDCALGGLFMVLLNPVGFKLLPDCFDFEGFDKMFVCVKCKKDCSVFLLFYIVGMGSICEQCFGEFPDYMRERYFRGKRNRGGFERFECLDEVYIK